MSGLKKVWNGKPAGVPSAIAVVFCVLGRRILKKIYSYFWSRNIAQCGDNVLIHPSVVTVSYTHLTLPTKRIV